MSVPAFFYHSDYYYYDLSYSLCYFGLIMDSRTFDSYCSFFFFNFKISVKKAMWLVSTNTFCKVSVCTTIRLIPMWIFPTLLYCLPRSQMDKENTWIERDSMTGRGRGDTLVWTSCWLWDNWLENEIKVICLNNTDNCFHLLKKKKRVRIW